MLEHREAAHQDRRSSQLDTPLEELDVEIRPPPTRLRGSRKDLSLSLDHVVSADDLVAVKAVASVVEIELRRLAPQGSLHFADDLAVFTELEISHREQRANCYEQTASFGGSVRRADRVTIGSAGVVQRLTLCPMIGEHAQMALRWPDATNGSTPTRRKLEKLPYTWSPIAIVTRHRLSGC